MAAAQDPFHLVLTGWQGVPVEWDGTVWETPPVFAPDGVTVVTPGVPEDLTGWTFLFTVKRRYEDLDAAAVYANDWLMPARPDGTWDFTLPDAETVDMAPATYFWDLKIIRAGAASPEMLLAGSLVINPTVTRRFTPNLTP